MVVVARPRKLSNEQRKVNIEKSKEKWKNKNKDKVRYIQYKSRAVNFINKKSTKEDLIFLKNLIDNKLLELKNKDNNDIG